MMRTLIRARKDKLNIYMGNCALPDGVLPEDVKVILSRFTKSIRPLGKIQWYLETGERYSGEVIKRAGNWSDTDRIEPIIYDEDEDDDAELDRLEEIDEINDRIHIHYLLVSNETITPHRIRELWTIATDCASQRETTVFHEGVRSISAATKYTTGNCKNKFYSGMFRRGKDIQVTGGSQNFHGGDKRKIYKQKSRSWAAEAIAREDGDILDHPTEAYYLALSDLDQVQLNGSNTSLPDSEELEAIMYGENQVSTNILHNYDAGEREAIEESSDEPIEETVITDSKGERYPIADDATPIEPPQVTDIDLSANHQTHQDAREAIIRACRGP